VNLVANRLAVSAAKVLRERRSKIGKFSIFFKACESGE